MIAAARTPTPATAHLAVRDLVAGYEKSLPIVKGVDLDLHSGEIVALLGPNGAGKSTFVKAVAGIVPSFSGTVAIDDVDIAALPAHRRVLRGLSFVPQTDNVFVMLSILENLQISAGILAPATRKGRIDAAFDMFPDLGARRSMAAGGLSGGQRQMLATARALIAEPSILVLDEPSAGLSPKLVHDVFETLRAIRASGVAILLVEQNVRAALAIADRGIILCEGRLRHQAEASELSADPNLGALFLGNRHQEEAAT